MSSDMIGNVLGNAWKDNDNRNNSRKQLSHFTYRFPHREHTGAQCARRRRRAVCRSNHIDWITVAAKKMNVLGIFRK